MQVTGKLIQKVSSGVVTRKDGSQVNKKDGSPLVKTEFVLQKQGKFPKQVKLDSFNADVIRMIADTDLETVLVCDVDLESREYNGRWYTTVNTFRVEKGNTDSPVVNPNELSQNAQQEVPIGDDADDLGLPF